MRVTLRPGEKIRIEFDGTDGGIFVAFKKNEIRADADLPDSRGRKGCIYREVFGGGRIIQSKKIIPHKKTCAIREGLLCTCERGKR